MDYTLKRIDAFTRFVDDGRICRGNNAAGGALRGIALGRKVGPARGSRSRSMLRAHRGSIRLSNADNAVAFMLTFPVA